MMIDLRCVNALHARFDPERQELDIKCRNCTRQLGRPIHHRWTLPELVAAYERGEVAGVCGPSDPRFVHWRVTGS